MTRTGYTRSPRLMRGALVELVRGRGGVEPRAIPFQYNPATMSRTLTPYNPFEVDQAGRGQQAPSAQPFDPKETISMTVELDAADRLGDGEAGVEAVGISDRIAAIEQLLLPVEGGLDEATRAAATRGGVPPPPARRAVSIVLLVWGQGRILPVRISTYSIEETSFLPSLVPLTATINLELEVLSPDVFKCDSDQVTELATAAYRFFRQRQKALAEAFRGRAAAEGLLPPLPR